MKKDITEILKKDSFDFLTVELEEDYGINKNLSILKNNKKLFKIFWYKYITLRVKNNQTKRRKNRSNNKNYIDSHSQGC